MAINMEASVQSTKRVENTTLSLMRIAIISTESKEGVYLENMAISFDRYSFLL